MVLTVDTISIPECRGSSSALPKIKGYRLHSRVDIGEYYRRAKEKGVVKSINQAYESVAGTPWRIHRGTLTAAIKGSLTKPTCTTLETLRRLVESWGIDPVSLGDLMVHTLVKDGEND